MVVLAKHGAARWLLGIVAGAFFLLVANFFIFSVPSTSADLQTYTDWCDTNSGVIMTDISYWQCLGLAQLYHDTNGPEWTYNTGWFVYTDIDFRHGVVLNGGMFSYFSLEANNLSGSITDMSLLGQTNGIFFANNNISAINLSGSDIRAISLSNNPMTEIDLTVGSNLLVDIYLDGTDINSLDLRGLHMLGYVAISNMGLESLITDTSGMYEFVYALPIGDNNLCEDALDANTIDFLDEFAPNWRNGQTCLPPLGSLENPYLITTCQEWKDINNDLDAYYQLTTDLDCTADGNTVMIGSSGSPFVGNLDGSGFMIQIDIDDASNYVGLFRATNNAAIVNFGVSGSVVGNNYVGGLIGYASDTSITNAYTTGAVSSNGLYLGGLIGWLNASTVTESFSYASVTAGSSSDAGGLVGYIVDSTIDGSYAKGDVSSIGYNVGGLVGSTNGATIANSYAEGNVTSSSYNVGGLVGYVSNGTDIYVSYALGNASGSNSVGGFVGGGSAASINRSYAMGDVTADAYAGGFVGYASYFTVSSCYAMGDTYAGNSAGSLFGTTDNGSVEECYSAGGTSGNFNIGGLVGINNGLETPFTNVFGDVTNRNPLYDTAEGGSGLTTEEMKDILTFDNAGWNIELRNNAVYNNGYPILTWQVNSNMVTWYINDETAGAPVVAGWTADNLFPDELASYTFTFIAPGDMSNPHLVFNFPDNFPYDGSNIYGDISISVDGGSAFNPGDISSNDWNPLYLDIVLGTDWQNPTPIASGSVIRVTINNILNPQEGIYEWNAPLFFGDGYSPEDFSLALDPVVIAGPVTDALGRCMANSGSINIPYQECIGLAYLFLETNGDDWYHNDGWFDDTDVSDWENYNCYSPVDEVQDILGFNRCDDANWFYIDGSYYSRAVMLTGAGPIKNVYAINLAYNNLDGAIGSGLAYFPELRVVDIQDNEGNEEDEGLTAVNLSQNPLLEIVDISDNDDDDIRTIDLTNSPLIWSLNVDDLYLEGINLSNNTGLIYVDIDGNELDEFDTNGLNMLQYLDISSNNITDFTSYAPALIVLDAYENSMDSVNLSNSPLLEEVDLDDNNLEMIDLSLLTVLDYLNLGYNNFTAIDLTTNVVLTDLDIADNDLQAIDVSMLSLLQYLDIEDNDVSDLDISSNLALYDLEASFNAIATITTAPFADYSSLSDIEIDYNGLCHVTNTEVLNILNTYAGSWMEYQYFCAPRNLEMTIDDNPVEIAWDSPKANASSEDNSTNVIDYTISWTPGNGSGIVDLGEEYYNNTTHSWDYTITGLEGGTEYTFTVCAIHTNEGPERTVCTSIQGTPGGQEQNQSCQGGCGSGPAPDYCPNGDSSGNYYDGKCVGTTGGKPKPVKLPKLKLNQIEKKKPIEFCKYNDTKGVSAAFTDIVGTPYTSAVGVLVSHCLVQGYGNNGQEFGINSPLKRGELYKVFTRMALLDFDLNHPGLGWSYGYKLAGQTVGLWNLLNMNKDQEAAVTQQELLQVTMNYLAYMGVLDEAPEFIFGTKEVTRGEFARFINTVLGLVSTK